MAFLLIHPQTSVDAPWELYGDWARTHQVSSETFGGLSSSTDSSTAPLFHWFCIFLPVPMDCTGTGCAFTTWLLLIVITYRVVVYVKSWQWGILWVLRSSVRGQVTCQLFNTKKYYYTSNNNTLLLYWVCMCLPECKLGGNVSLHLCNTRLVTQKQVAPKRCSWYHFFISISKISDSASTVFAYN